jgi:GT2 family glycosyltransferase
MHTSVTVGIITWNSSRFLSSCLNALLMQEYQDYELVIVDNGSTDDSLNIVERYFPDSIKLLNAHNLGFCVAHNQAIRTASGDLYLPLNPDVILDRQYISVAVETMNADPSVGMVATKLYLSGSEGKKLDSTGLFIDRRRRQYLRGFGEIDSGQFDQPEEVFGVDGAAPLYRRAMLEDIKVDGQYFDEAFFAHKEDVDLSWRARLFGWKCMYTPAAVAYHQRSFRPGKRLAISSEIKLHAVKNRYLMLIKNESLMGLKRDWAHILWYDLKILAYLTIYERSSLKAFSLLKQNWKRAKEWREQIQQKARISENEILSWFDR